jgi:hypothetical protein
MERTAYGSGQTLRGIRCGNRENLPEDAHPATWKRVLEQDPKWIEDEEDTPSPIQRMSEGTKEIQSTSGTSS